MVYSKLFIPQLPSWRFLTGRTRSRDPPRSYVKKEPSALAPKFQAFFVFSIHNAWLGRFYSDSEYPEQLLALGPSKVELWLGLVGLELGLGLRLSKDRLNDRVRVRVRIRARVMIRSMKWHCSSKHNKHEYQEWQTEQTAPNANANANANLIPNPNPNTCSPFLPWVHLNPICRRLRLPCPSWLCGSPPQQRSRDRVSDPDPDPIPIPNPKP